ncbi:MAG: MoxR family ATPase [Gemmatimonas sp.]
MSEESWRAFSNSKVAGADAPRSVPSIARMSKSGSDPSGYIVPRDLADAVDVAIALGQPLLLMGEPGTGKTELAHHIAWKLFGEHAKAIVFNTKTTSTARDLFYSYDSIRHFRDAQLGKSGEGAAVELRAQDYINYQGLGLAILLARSDAESNRLLPEELRGFPARQSVVLIDEIDKAPRDLPNDILHEIERMHFHVPETGKEYSADDSFRPIVILTSNSERMLPEPFLRRCVFHNLKFPEGEELKTIVLSRLGLDNARPASTIKWIDGAIAEFNTYRGKMDRKPATAELLSWLRWLQQIQSATNSDEPWKHASGAAAKGALAKTKEDRAKLEGV